MNHPIKILFLAANPKDTDRLRLDEEIRGIDQALRQAEFRDKFDLEQQWAVRVADLQSYFLRHKPDIVHFSGHGSASNEIILEDNDGNSQPVSSRALSQLFSVLKDNIRCVALNACYSKQQAKAIAKHIDCVIGMSKAIGDSAAISFAIAFYQALGYGRDIKTAFELGRLQLDLENLNERDIPKLLAFRSNPQEIVFIKTCETPSDGTLEIVSITPTDQAELDVKLINLGDNTVFITKITVQVLDEGEILKPSLEPSAKYEIPIDSLKVGETKSLDVSHIIEPHQADRFLIALDTTRILLVRITFEYNKKYSASHDVWLWINPCDEREICKNG